MKYERKDAKAWTRESLRRYMVCTTTPFLADGSIDEAGLRENVEHYVGLDCVGAVYSGSLYSECFALSLPERKRVAELVVDAVAGRVPVMVSASANNVSESVDLAHHGEQIGADLAMLWPPTFGHRTREGVESFFQQVARSVDIGLCMYSSTLSDFGFYVDVSMLEVLAREENIVAVKEASMSPATYLNTLQRVGDQLTVSCPLEEYWIQGRQMVGDRYAAPVLLGTSRPLYLETKEKPYLSAFLEAESRGDYADIGATLREILIVANELHNKWISRGEHNVAIAKAITELVGRHAGGVRAPLTWPSEIEMKEAREVLEAAGLMGSTR